MKKLVITFFSILLLANMPNSFAAGADDLKRVSDGVLVCAGGPPTRQVIRNLNHDLYLLIDSIEITDGSGVTHYASWNHGFGPLKTNLGPRQGIAFRIIDALEVLAEIPEDYVKTDLRGPWQTTISFSLVNDVGAIEGGLAPFVISNHFIVDASNEYWSFRDQPIAAFSSTCRYIEMTEIQKVKVKD